MFNQIFKTVDTLPLAGKYSIAPIIKEYIESSDSEEKSKYKGTQALLTFMVGAHAVQAVMGYNSLSTHVDTLVNSEVDPLTYVNTAVDAVYMSINGLVTARQANLMYRVEDIRKKKSRNKNERPERESEPYASGKGKALLLALGVTLVGQAAFGQSYIHAHDQAETLACETHISEFYDEFVEDRPTAEFIPKDMYIEEVCG